MAGAPKREYLHGLPCLFPNGLQNICNRDRRHASTDESNKDELAKARAQKIIDQLVQKGIAPERLKCKSYGDSRPFETYDENGLPIKITDKKLQRLQSRQVTIMLLSRDYKPAGE